MQKKKNHDEKNINILSKNKINITDCFFSFKFQFGLAWDWSFFISNVDILFIVKFLH